MSDGITRNVRHQIERALEYLGAPEGSHHPGSSQTEVVGEVRKCFKRVRAALRLVREDLGDDRYHEENWCFRDAARPLTEVRDAGILVETFKKLRQECPAAIGAGTFRSIQQALLANQQEVTHRVLEAGGAFAAVARVASAALPRLSEWPLERDGWGALESGMRHVYGTGHRALALALENPSVENLHEWRKQAKYLWHELQLIEASLTAEEAGLVTQAHQLSTLLGEDHDLAVLRQTLAADPLAYGGHRVLKSVFVIIDRRRQDFQHEAFAVGREIYRDPPRVFTGRIKASMDYDNPTKTERDRAARATHSTEPGSAVEAGRRKGQTWQSQNDGRKRH